MEQAVIQYLQGMVKPDTFLILAAIYLLYKKIKTLDGGVRAGLLSHLTRIHSGAIANKCIAKDTLRIAEECFNQYKNMGGDGYADNIMREIRELPIKK